LTLKLSGFEISKTELNAFFRKPDHRNYKKCGDQVLSRFLDGLIIKMRGPVPSDREKVRIVKIRGQTYTIYLKVKSVGLTPITISKSMLK
jgi:hypothetical protein